ncbi:MAG: trehalose-phosphatase [Acidimicrobiales bacterium]
MTSPDETSRLVAVLVENPSRTGVFCDFDGTLASIVDEPSQAQPAEGAVDALAALGRSFARVAVISGRPARFLDEHLGRSGVMLAGLYGLERVEHGRIEVADEARRWEPVVAEVADRARRHAPDGLGVEPKGLTVTFHFRTRPELAQAARELVEREAEATGLEAAPGRLSWELRPPVPTSKGTVVAEAAAGLAAACFLGDDHGDLTAFDALDDLAAQGTTAVRVAVRSPESPDELLDRADLVVDGPPEVVSFLRRLVPRLS